MICGNEESVILRCLDSARPAIDELCLVRAVGSLTHDGTITLANEWASVNKIPFRWADYRNEKICVGFDKGVIQIFSADPHTLPHVDNFAAARNISFSLATSEWLLWLDCDDYLDEINCRRIREAVSMVESEDDPFSAIFATYKVASGGAEILRERLIRRGKWSWRGEVHETCRIDGPVVKCPQIVVFHGEHSHKDLPSAQRNVAILRETLADSGRQYFYYHNDLKLTGDKSGALKSAHAALLLL